MTFSIVGRCPETGQLGIAISSSSIAVGARCPWVRAGVGAVATQNITLPALGPQILDLIEHEQLAPAAALDRALADLGWIDASKAGRALDARVRGAVGLCRAGVIVAIVQWLVVGLAIAVPQIG
ncbi:DUF1028 domain-containing protein [Burkholderia sp. Ac-20392]|nr:DUF1028 domain-containing protein [Burkholderia sp. Ac-20392]